MNDKKDTSHVLHGEFIGHPSTPSKIRSEISKLHANIDAYLYEDEIEVLSSTQKYITEINKDTVLSISSVAEKNAEAIASIGRAHESKASESIEQIVQMTLATQKALRQESKDSKNTVFSVGTLAVGMISGAGIIALYNKFKK
ncbi:hypothetical protein [Erwinia sp. Leaf53]|uniref:hypothetical protein n=1 Tax=Erwinia sp. Leaf53 TaxID=1736225 RepID=UPI000701C089|nr:hypothetical protein [Erwinia sp. Leaf53]KQN63642.1 hypothetical protein ASF13_18880 [Erwinia sp. Leaf53]